jgi:hypothetical protein
MDIAKYCTVSNYQYSDACKALRIINDDLGCALQGIQKEVEKIWEAELNSPGKV